MNRHWAACFVTTLSLAVTASLFASAVRAKGAAISDRQITSAIGRRFLADDEIPAELILLTDKSFPTDQSPKDVRDAHEERVKNFASSIREMLSRK